MKYIIALLLFSSCSKSTYVIKQGIGQLALEWNGKSNQSVLQDPKVSKEHKEKIKHIIKIKKFFYDYFDREPSRIYEQTTFLDSEAVTYLVIRSPYDRVEAIKTHFPLVGSFPYLGFFSEKDADDYMRDQQKEYSVYKRNVYAYSTLDRWIFDDNILSSFFHYNERQLTQLIFHELIHTVLFIKDEVTFNENLAQYFGEELTSLYYQDSKEQKDKSKKDKEYKKKLISIVKEFANELNRKYENTQQPQKLLAQELKNNLFNKLKDNCQTFNKDCSFKISDWNNARIAAYLTYHEELQLFDKIRDKYGFTLKQLLGYFIDKNKEYRRLNDHKSFIDFIKGA